MSSTDSLELALIKARLKLLFHYLDYTEESDSGYVFNPVHFSCCRTYLMEPFSKVLKELKEHIKEK